MPIIDTPVLGSFCWVEANLENPAQGKTFYSELFGWKGEDKKISAGDYTLMKLGEHLVCGLLPLPANAKKMGAPPHWLGHVAVDDAAAATKKAEKLGARVFFGPENVGPGVMAVLGDPTGAAFAVWQRLEPLGTLAFRETNSFCWMELTTKDVAAATRFYVDMFGWTAESVSVGDTAYTLLKNQGEQVGGLVAQPPPMALAKAPSFWTVYFEVADCDATANKAKALGGEIVMPPADIPNIGRFGILKDNGGAAFGIITNSPSP